MAIFETLKYEVGDWIIIEKNNSKPFKARITDIVFYDGKKGKTYFRQKIYEWDKFNERKFIINVIEDQEKRSYITIVFDYRVHHLSRETIKS